MQTESPIHIELLFKRIVAFQQTTLGSRIRGALEFFTEQQIKTGKIQKRGEFIWKANHTLSEPRSFESLPKKNIEWVAPEEIELAICHVVKESFSINTDELNSEVSKRLGFKNTESVRSVITEGVVRLISRCVLQQFENGIVTFAE